MGKKRRAIHRSRKFTSKYYSWLDTVDSTGVIETGAAKTDNILEGTKPYVKSVTVTDKGNQLIDVSAQLEGHVITGADKVTFTVDGMEVYAELSSNTITFAEQEKSTATARAAAGKSADKTPDDAGSGKNRYTVVSGGTKLTDSAGIALVLKPGTHTLLAEYHDGGGSGVGKVRPKDSKQVDFVVKEHEITLSGSPFTQAINNVNLNRALFDTTADISGYANRGNLNNAIMHAGSATNGWSISVTRVIAGVTTAVVVNDAAQTANCASDDAATAHATVIQVLKSDFDAADYTEGDSDAITLSITLTPRDSGDRDASGDGLGRDLAGSAKTFTLVMAKP